MIGITPPFRHDNTDFAYQLHFHLGFRTRYGMSVFRSGDRLSMLNEVLSEICGRSNYHLLEWDASDNWVRLLLSLRPAHAPAKVAQTLKANASRFLFDRIPELEGEMGRRSLWSRAYYLRGVGDVTNATVLEYVAGQRAHHEERGDSRLLASYCHPNPRFALDFRTLDHCAVEYNCHLVLCPVRHVPAIDVAVADDLVKYVLAIAHAKAFDVLSFAVLEDHLHLVAALRPAQSPEFLAMTMMNNSWHWLWNRNPGAFRLWNTESFWMPSAFVRTAGAVTTDVVRAHIQGVGVLTDT